MNLYCRTCDYTQKCVDKDSKELYKQEINDGFKDLKKVSRCPRCGTILLISSYLESDLSWMNRGDIRLK